MKNVGLYTFPRNVFPPPKCLIRISGYKMFCFTDLLEICFHPQNVWHEYQDIIENVGFYTPPRNMFPPPKFWHEYQDRIENVGSFTYPRNMFPPPNVWHEYQDRIENVFFFTYPRNIFPPPKCLVQI